MKPITTTFFSTLDRQQTIDCLKFLLLPWKWKNLKNGKCVKEAEELMKNYLSIKSPQSSHDDGENCDRTIYSFYNGRAALYYALKTAGVKKGDDVIIQAYTCVTVPNAVIEVGAKPVYCDIDETLNLDPDDLRKKITNKTKAVIIQHTFGTPARIDEIKKVCDDCHPSQRIILIEDCAHSLGAKYNNRPTGSFGDISMFSFGRDKVISSINGGMLCINNKNLKIENSHIKDGYCLPSPPYLLIIRNLLYPILAEISLKWYNNLKIGKIIMYASKKLKLFPLILNKREKTGNSYIHLNYYRMPNVLAYLLIKQFKKMDGYNEHRKNIAKFYDENLNKINILIPQNNLSHSSINTQQRPSRRDIPRNIDPIFLRYTIFTKKAKELIKTAKQHNIYLGDWYRTPVAPKDINLASIGYEQNMCSKAEKYATLTVNLPNHKGITLGDAKMVVEVIKKFQNQNCSKLSQIKLKRKN
ncbi:MAG: aminotransferase class V-fold PLP-dependent enzyme [bacterium]